MDVLLYIVSMLQSCKSADEAERLSSEGQAMLQLIEDSNKPVVSAIMGSCLGGGLEVDSCYIFIFVFCTFCLRFGTEVFNVFLLTRLVYLSHG